MPECIIAAGMELDGKLSRFGNDEFWTNIARERINVFFLEIEFTKEQGVPIEAEEMDRKYIGTIQVNEHEPGDFEEIITDKKGTRIREIEEKVVRIFVRINLPWDMYSQLSLMEGKNIRFETVHEIIEDSDERQRLAEDMLLGGLLAFVKRVHFEIPTETQD